MSIDSTSGSENFIADWLKENYKPDGATIEIHEIPNGMKNLLYKWGNPKIIFCSHLDTVPPFIPPIENQKVILGRGACDAKGQVAVMAKLCEELHKSGEDDFGLLLLAGEETGSYGAKLANKLIKGCKYVIIGEPTENKLIKACKGSILFSIKIKGKSCHSGYPQLGDSAMDRFVAFLNNLYHLSFPLDDILGHTSFNIGRLISHNAPNVVSDSVEMELYFRTTFITHELVLNALRKVHDQNIEIKITYNDLPIKFKYINGFESGIVSYGSDASDLTNLGTPLLYGAGSISYAHTLNEHIAIDDIIKAKSDLLNIYNLLADEIESQK